MSSNPRSKNETSDDSLNRARHGGASLRAIHANSTPNANHRSGLDNNREPKGWPCVERVCAGHWRSANCHETGHAKRRSDAHTCASALNLAPRQPPNKLKEAGCRSLLSLCWPLCSSSRPITSFPIWPSMVGCAHTCIRARSRVRVVAGEYAFRPFVAAGIYRGAISQPE